MYGSIFRQLDNIWYFLLNFRKYFNKLTRMLKSWTISTLENLAISGLVIYSRDCGSYSRDSCDDDYNKGQNRWENGLLELLLVLCLLKKFFQFLLSLWLVKGWYKCNCSIIKFLGTSDNLHFFFKYPVLQNMYPLLIASWKGMVFTFGSWIWWHCPLNLSRSMDKSAKNPYALWWEIYVNISWNLSYHG